MAGRSFRSAGHTRWARLALVAVPVLALSGVLVAGVGAGALPASFAVSARSVVLSGRTLQISADRLDGQGFTQYVAADHSARGDRATAVTGVRSADLHRLCQSTVIDLPGVGHATLRIRAGGGGTPAHADHLVVHTDAIAGDATFRNIVIGEDAGSFADVPDAPAGAFGQRADTVRIDHLRQQATAVSASVFRLNGLSMTVTPGVHPCY
ncbi:DUF6230 family protein [Streptomyces palmae]|uniref:Cholesterol esterase n=1 Tax=Streptomyces palmae TaxID=1701085 RepID=A0A4Z0H9T1_9ACTN|nr:DUF6230 family protein [Streptomyces palmae]TGB12029.1 cholesterol esterase [Streptomyces palmae]